MSSIKYRPLDFSEWNTIPGVEARVSREVRVMRSVAVKAGVDRHRPPNHRSRNNDEVLAGCLLVSVPAVSGQLRSVGKSLSSFFVT